MFSSSPSDKNCINSDTCSTSRNNAPNRFSVGIAPLGDENQQIRIQLAVHKYNGTAVGPFNNRCSFVSPVRHSFLKNSLKVRNYEGDHEGTSKTDKRKGNQYEGVGSFPTVHLKKNAVRYRPIKRFHDVKIPYPEIPVNRFLSHLPEVCQDLKPSTRSVLDVLEDLSGNKIHSKDDNGSGKLKPRGLGGDHLMNPNAVFKPLFVQKPKLNAVLTRDNTTQTLSPVSVDTPSPQSSTSSYVRNGPSDPRAELRRKLAKQNNEIFASLSSSISSAFCLKRKIDKVLPSKGDGQLNEGSTVKKSKISDNSRDLHENGIAKSVTSPAPNPREPVKLNRKTKFTDANSVSPNKDRLTAIFLDTRNTSPKARVFQANASSESNPAEKGAEVTNGGLLGGNDENTEKTASPFGGNFAGGKGKDEGSEKSTSINSSGKSSPDNPETEQSDKTVVNFIAGNSNTAVVDIPKSTSTSLQFVVNSVNKASFSSPKTQTGAASYLSETPKTTMNGNESEKRESESKQASREFAFGSSSDKPQFGSFKFEVDGSTTSPVPNKTFTDNKQTVAAAVSTAGSIATKPTPQFSLSSASNVTASPLQTTAVHFVGVTSSQNIFVSPGKPTFTFGQNPSPAQQNSTNADAKHETLHATSTTTNTQSTMPATFTFGQKTIVGPATSPPSQTSQSMASFGQKTSPRSTETAGPVFVLGQKPETSVASQGPTAPVQQQQITTFPFAFGGQKSDFGQNDAKVESGQKSGASVSTEQKPASQVPRAEGSAVTACVTAPSQPSAQSGSPVAIAPHSTFTPNSEGQTSTALGSSLNGFGTASPVFPDKPVSFGTSANAFGKTTTQTATGFTASTSTAPAFGFPGSTTTRSLSTFGASPVTQSAPTFGSSSAIQSASPFPGSSAPQTSSAIGTSTSHSTPGFAVPSSTQTPPSFPVSSAPLSTPAFGSSDKQTGLSFSTTSTTQSTSTFSSVSSQPKPLFGTSVPTQTTFATPTAFGLPSSQSSSVFGAPTSTQSPLRFGSSTTQSTPPTFGSSAAFTSAPATQAAPAFGAPTSTPSFPPSLDNKPAASLSQTPNIFAQNPSPAFSSATPFTSTQNNIFAPKPSPEPSMFGQNKLHTSGFGSTGQAFGASQNKFSFGMSTSSATGLTTSPPTTTAPMVFSFGAGTNNAFTFGGNSSGSSNASAPFAFARTPANEPFKFGAATTAPPTATTTTTKEGTAFGGGGSTSFSFATQMANPPVADQKPSFNFGGAQPSTSAPGFSFGTTPSPSVFNFGGAAPSGSSGSNFNFGTPTGGVGFGQGAASAGTPFAVPGTFSIGSGSSQSRPRASSRPRRRQ